MIIGITGNFCYGKTTVTAMFKRLGAAVIDADKIGHKLLKRADVKKRLVKAFGKEILRGKVVDRKKLGDVVFKDKKKVKKLDNITHPLLIKEIKKQIKNKKTAVIDAALLFEFKARLADKIVVVYCKKKTALQRAVKNGFSKKQALNIMESQLSISKKIKKADYVINNSYSLAKTKEQVIKIWQRV